MTTLWQTKTFYRSNFVRFLKKNSFAPECRDYLLIFSNQTFIGTLRVKLAPLSSAIFRSRYFLWLIELRPRNFRPSRTRKNPLVKMNLVFYKKMSFFVTDKIPFCRLKSIRFLKTILFVGVKIHRTDKISPDKIHCPNTVDNFFFYIVDGGGRVDSIAYCLFFSLFLFVSAIADERLYSLYPCFFEKNWVLKTGTKRLAYNGNAFAEQKRKSWHAKKFHTLISERAYTEVSRVLAVEQAM